jgi:hypothetical protein
MHDVSIVDDVGPVGQRQRGREVPFDKHHCPSALDQLAAGLIKSRTMTGAKPSNGSPRRMSLRSVRGSRLDLHRQMICDPR